MPMRRVASGMSLPTPAIFTSLNCPLISICGVRPGEKIRSLTCFETCSIVATIAAVDTLGAAGEPEETSELAVAAGGGMVEASADIEISWGLCRVQHINKHNNNCCWPKTPGLF